MGVAIMSRKYTISDIYEAVIVEVLYHLGSMYQIDLIESVKMVLRRLYPTAERFKRISSDAIRKKIDRLINLGVLREEKVSKYHIISLRSNLIIEYSEILNQTVVRVRDILRDLESLDRIRISHTRKIRERIIIPWIRSLKGRKGCGYENNSFYYYNIKKLASDPLFEDLSNHIPRSLKNPKEINEKLEDLDKKYDSVKTDIINALKDRLNEIADVIKRVYPNVTWNFKALANALVDIREVSISPNEFFSEDFLKGCLRIEKDKDQIAISLGAWRVAHAKNPLDKDAVLDVLRMVLEDKIIKSILSTLSLNPQDTRKSLDNIRRDIRKTVENLLKTLRKLETYEILPGICEYLVGE